MKLLFWCLFSVVTNAVFLLYRRLSYRLLGKLIAPLKMWKSQALLVHFVLLVCVLKIYFQPAPLTHLEPQMTLKQMGVQPAADRLVVFLADGLRAETFFSLNYSRVPHLADLYRRQGLLGSAHSSVPTLTRSGNVALFAGFHPVPSIFSYEKYDNIFNRTLASADGIVIKFVSDNPKTGSVLTDLQDFLADEGNLGRIKNATRVLIVVCMDDIGGASPWDQRYLKKLLSAQRGIREAHDMMETLFKDRKTAYLMTSAHGLSNLGSYGAGSLYETETPFLLWGAGIKANLTIHRLQQIQLAPLMSALIGLPPPVNSLAQLPLGYLKVSRDYERKAMHLNALQLLLKAKILVRRHERGAFHKWLPKAGDLDLVRISHYQYQMNRVTTFGWRSKALETSTLAARLAVKTLKYYAGYYHIPLVVATALGLLGWQFYLMLKLSRDSWVSQERRSGYLTWTTIVLAALGLLLGELAFLQGSSFLTAVCLVVPFALWCLALAELPLKGHYILDWYTHVLWIIISAVVIVVALCYSRFIGPTYALCVGAYNRWGWVRPSRTCLYWLILVILMSAFLSSLPGMQFLMATNWRVALQGTSMLLVILRPYILMENHPLRVWLVNGGALILGAIGIYLRETGRPVPIYMLAANWTYLIYAFASIPYSVNSCLRSRLELIGFNLLTVHALLSDSYTSLFAQALIAEYQLGIEVHLVSRRPDRDEEDKEESILAPSQHLEICFRFGASIILYFLVSLMGTGHWMQSFSYLANTDRLFMPHSCSVMLGLLVFIHMIIPIVIILSSLRALSTFGRHEISSIFICVMLICSGVTLVYVVFIPHLVGWPSIHPSVVHVLLAQLTVVVLMVCDSCGYFLFRGFNLITSPAPKRAVVAVRPKVIVCSSPSSTSSEV